jgi:hypothetical protein
MIPQCLDSPGRAISEANAASSSMRFTAKASGGLVDDRSRLQTEA